MSSRSHVVHFSASRVGKNNSRNDLSTEYRALPVLIKNIQNIFVNQLEIKLITMLNTADDRLFDMAENSFNNAQFDAMRLLRVKREGLINCFKKELHNNFKQALGRLDSQTENYDNVETLSFENIALVKDDDLEENIATDGMVNKAKTKNQDALEHIRVRIDTLIADQTIDEQNNPLEPVFICDAFRTATQTLDLDIASLLIIYKLFDRSVVSELNDVYKEVNDYFIQKGILPDLKSQIKQQAKKNARTTQSVNQQNNEYNGNNAYQELEQGNVQTSSEVQNHQGSVVNQDSVWNVLQQLMTDRRVTEQQVNLQNGAQIPMMDSMANNPQNRQPVDTQQLISALSSLQINQLQNTITNNVLAVQAINNVDLRASIGQQIPELKSAVEQGALGQYNEDMIDIVSMLFDVILEDTDLSSELKGVIARLQIPMLKVGLVDKSFFSNRKHPARALLNELARAGLSLDAKDVLANPMFNKISETANVIINDFSDDVSLFENLLEDFLESKNLNDRKSNIIEKRTKEAEIGKAKSETARIEVNVKLQAICDGFQLPDVAKSLLKSVCSHTLLLDRLQEDKDSWKRHVRIAKLLIWSVQPIKTAERLEKLTSKVPILLKSLRKDIEAISISPIESTRLLDELESKYRNIIEYAREYINSETKEDILRLPAIGIEHNIGLSGNDLEDIDGNNSEIEIVSSEASVEKIESIDNSIQEDTDLEGAIFEEIVIEDVGFSKVETGQIETGVSSEPIHINPEIRERVEELRAGSWVELMIDEEFKRCKLAARIASTGKYIFVNRSGIKMAEFLTHDLCVTLQLEKLKILDDDALFDRALESVISNLRNMKAEA
ncbi:MAG: hypothetical protein ACJAS9_000688 [Polaribacter sp.]